MKTKIVKEKEQETVLSKKNYIILIIGSILIIAGYILMSGEGSSCIRPMHAVQLLRYPFLETDAHPFDC